ncbi:MAG TPA: cation:proton antiporter [Solirubrobacteraceae bacterium]|nr:cation:proton antiporter [Solirubrobacteraceae bacterium]
MTTLALDPGLHAGDHYAIALLFGGVALVVAIAALSHEHERAWSAAVIYLGLGLVAAVGFHLLDVEPLSPLNGNRVAERVCELAILPAVFTAGLSIERLVSGRQWRSVAVLIGIVMPLTIAAIALFASVAMGLSLGAAVLLGAILAPTDPVLAGDVGLSPPGEHDDARDPQFSLHTEAGLNDGLAAPFVLAGVLIATEGGTGWIAEWVLADVLYAIALATLVGAVAGYAIAAATVRLRDREFLSHDFDAFVALAAVLLVYGTVEALGAYGFLAVFWAGFTFRRYEFEHEVNRRIHDGADEYAKLLELGAILVLGSFVTLEGLGEPGLAGWLLAPLLVFVIRPGIVLPLAAGSLMGWGQRLFLAWFGVRGIAAIFYAAYVAHTGALSPAETTTVFWTTVVVVMVSIVVHGTSASPLTRRMLERAPSR